MRAAFDKDELEEIGEAASHAVVAEVMRSWPRFVLASRQVSESLFEALVRVWSPTVRVQHYGMPVYDLDLVVNCAADVTFLNGELVQDQLRRLMQDLYGYAVRIRAVESEGWVRHRSRPYAAHAGGAVERGDQ